MKYSIIIFLEFIGNLGVSPIMCPDTTADC